ncbi:hypothetical protein OG500_22665 [Kitasatospora sp. NBC_01250]|uniref:hypothetical protein n=1 Tax=unclassified Kitasatospora TaxID=2633591 RepID=UPI002E152590|nr:MULTISPECIES: hypothetical protein [unclassified Kitasatospora]WSJ68844.1 hypothetical protein OG294_23510 [Kitasatospora sp. NBC_01302]
MVEMVSAGDGGPVAAPSYFQQGAKNATYDMARQLAVDAGGTQNLSLEMETLTEFKKRVDAMLTSLDGSDASQPKIAQQSLEQTHFGTGFPQSGDLYSAYNIVHTNLETLSTALSNQIEAMSIAINISINGYQNVDDSQRETLWKIHNQTDAQYTSGVNPTGIVAAVPSDGTTTSGTTTTGGTTTQASVTTGGTTTTGGSTTTGGGTGSNVG